jgi:hypothetical protein
MQDTETGESKYQRVRRHIDEISILAGILYKYVSTLRDGIKSKEIQIDDEMKRLKEIISSIRNKRITLNKDKTCIEECKQVLKKCYRINLDALETAEEL